MKFNLLALALALAVAFGLSMGSFAGSILDADADGIPNSYDNCENDANGPLGAGASQCFTNQDGDDDGYGNQCDSDFNNDGATGLDDLTDILGSISLIDAERDLNCDGAVGLDDLTVVLGSISTTPGPSGLACAVANVKGTCPPL
jgi:hypothetical protein